MTDWYHGSLLNDMVDNQLAMDDKFVWAEPCWPTSFRNYPIPDVLTIKKSFSNPCPSIYEIKTSRSDFMSDINSGKWHKYLPYCQRFYFAVPRGMIKRSEIPDGAGLITRSEKGWRIIKGARHNQYKELPNDVMLALMMRHLQEIQRVRNLEERTSWMKNKKLSEQLLYHRREILDKVMDLERFVEERKETQTDHRAVRFVESLARHLELDYEDVVRDVGWSGLPTRLYLRDDVETEIIRNIQSLFNKFQNHGNKTRKKTLRKIREMKDAD